MTKAHVFTEMHLTNLSGLTRQFIRLVETVKKRVERNFLVFVCYINVHLSSLVWKQWLSFGNENALVVVNVHR